MTREKTEAEAAIDRHIASVWEVLQNGRDIAAVHNFGPVTKMLPSWDSLDEPSKFAFMALAMPALRQLLILADSIVAELGPDQR